MRRLLAATLALQIIVLAPARADLPVFDGANFAESLLQAARMLEEIANQVRQIEQFTQMLEYQARNVANLAYSAVPDLAAAITNVTGLMRQAQGILFDVQNVAQQFARYYPETSNASSPDVQLVADARTRWTHALAAFRQAMSVQSEIVGGIDRDQVLMNTLVDQSQSAIGILQTAQAGNQLLALQVKQYSGLQALLAAQGRAQALDLAGKAEAQEQAREQFRRFLAPGGGYTPAPVRMFHE